MKLFVWIAVTCVTLLFQTTVVPILLPGSVRPDLLLIFVVSSGLLFGHERAVGIGFFAGLLQDLTSGNIFGLHILSKMAAGYIAGMAEKKVFKEHLFLPMAAMLVFSLLNSALILTLLVFLGYTVEWAILFGSEVLPAIVVNVLFSVPAHQAVYRLARRFG